MADQLVVYEVLIPRTDDRTGLVHPIGLLDTWVIDTVDRFGGITQLGTNLKGLWYDGKRPVEDYSNWYRVAVPPSRVEELREYMRSATHTFGQQCIYFQECGRAELLYPS